MTIYIEEFLYRGKSPSSAQPASWHLVLGDEVTNGFGKNTISFAGPMTPAQAKDLNFDLPVVLAAINTAVMGQLTVKTSELAAKSADLDAEKVKSAGLDTQLVAEKEKSANLQAQLDALGG